MKYYKERSTKHNLIQLILIITAYIGANTAAIFVPFMPGYGTMIFWAIIFPLCLIGIGWFYTFRLRHDVLGRVILGGILSSFSASLGFLSYLVIGTMWAVV